MTDTATFGPALKVRYPSTPKAPEPSGPRTPKHRPLMIVVAIGKPKGKP